MNSDEQASAKLGASHQNINGYFIKEEKVMGHIKIQVYSHKDENASLFTESV